jgi:MinD-like ATPase involved in chromosome partitioning or flagellar assembly
MVVRLSPGAVICVHSYRGGTGKTTISVNMGAILAKQGKNVCLIDLDLRAPSLGTTFTANRKYWINDFLMGKCEHTDVLKDFSNEKGTDGRLLVGLANPSMDAIREIVTNSKRQEISALRRLLLLKKLLVQNLNMDYVFIDTNPGPSYASINAVMASDLVLVVSTLDVADIAGTKNMIGDLYDLFDKRAIVIINKIPAQSIMSGEMEGRIAHEFMREYKLPVVDFLPCNCDVQMQERTTIMALEKPNHPFSKSLAEVAEKFEWIWLTRRKLLQKASKPPLKTQSENYARL